MAEKLASDNSRTTDVNIVTEKLSACANALDDLKDIYNNKFLTDVILKTKTNSFPAHKIVLCARSPVFKLMFSDEMREKNSNSIHVDDLEDDIVQRLLIFLYSDSVQNLQWKSATKLYHAADKYQIEKLKLICSSFLLANLTVSTATELLLLADSHSDSDLKHVLEDFISEHEENVFNSKEWQEVMEINPPLALKLMPSKFKPKTSVHGRLTRTPVYYDRHQEEKCDHGKLTRTPMYYDRHQEKKEDKIYSASDDLLKKKNPGNFFNRVARRFNPLSPQDKQDNTNVTKNKKERYQQNQKNKFQNNGIQNITPKCNYCENSNVETERHLYVDSSYLYNQRQRASENAKGIMFQNRASPDLHRHEDFKELYQPESLSKSLIINKDNVIEFPVKGGDHQIQMDKFQNTAKQNISPENICSGNSGVHIETNNLVCTNYPLSQIQGSSESAPNIYFQTHMSNDLHRHADSTEFSWRTFPKPEIFSGSLIYNKETSKELIRREQQKQINKFQKVGKPNISPENSYRVNPDHDSEIDDFGSTAYHHNQRKELPENAPDSASKKRVSYDSSRHINSTEATGRSLYNPENLSERRIISKETSVEKPIKREYQQMQMNKNQNNTGTQNKTPENSCSENSHSDSEIDNFVSTNCYHNQRHELSENSLDISSKKRVSHDSYRHINSTEAIRRRPCKHENHSERMISSKETSVEKSIKRIGQQRQMNKNQNTGTQNKTTESSYSENFNAEIDKVVSTTYLHYQRQESSKNSLDIKIKRRVPPELNRCEDSTDNRRGFNSLEMRSQKISPSGLAKIDRFVINCFVLLVFSGLACFVIKLSMDSGYLPTLYENYHLNTTSLVNRLRSNFKDQPPLTFRIIGSVLKNVLEAEPKAPAIILLLAANGSKTMCSEFASNLIDLLSVPKYTVKIYGENYKEENAKQTKLEIDQIISKSLKFNQLGSVLIDDVDQIPGEAAIILHKYYDHENAPFKKAVFVMTANYNMPINDYRDLKVWQKAANDHLRRAWADAGIDQVSALLSRLIVSVAVITSDTLY